MEKRWPDFQERNSRAPSASAHEHLEHSSTLSKCCLMMRKLHAKDCLRTCNLPVSNFAATGEFLYANLRSRFPSAHRCHVPRTSYGNVPQSHGIVVCYVNNCLFLVDFWP
ncbi:hypothetical protein M758_2G106600 [Ceratodon purpureus]|nr:hypothetical protein M758_2G106600 [Ceratodon purpureus]